ncbi:MAG: 2TM domain-containing protein [Paracoccaceae bacterium]
MILHTLRKYRGWSLEQMAEMSGISMRTILRIERGERDCLHSLKRSAKAINTTITKMKMKMEKDMTNKDQPVESDEPNQRRRAEKIHCSNRGDQPDDPNLSPEENSVSRQVRRERGFYVQVVTYLGTLGFLYILNIMTNPDSLWVIWPALGMGMASFFQAIRVFGPERRIGGSWEHKQIEKRLSHLVNPTGRN